MNDIGLEDDGILKADQLIDVDPLSDEFAKEMALIDDDEIETLRPLVDICLESSFKRCPKA